MDRFAFLVLRIVRSFGRTIAAAAAVTVLLMGKR
jgi:hypothetical protein